MGNYKEILYRDIQCQDIEKIKSCLPKETQKKCLRQLREKECFKYTDRPIWYNKLTEYQKQEINKWYEEWLNVTETFVIPEKPIWVK